MRVGGIAFSRFWCSLVGLEVERAFLWRESAPAEEGVFQCALGFPRWPDRFPRKTGCDRS